MKSKRKPLTKIQKLAKGSDCFLVTGVCRHQPEYVCLCHAPHVNRAGLRKDDEWAAPGCDRCHDLLDGRTGPAAYNQEIISKYGHPYVVWYPAVKRWQDVLKKAGLMIATTGHRVKC